MFDFNHRISIMKKKWSKIQKSYLSCMSTKGTHAEVLFGFFHFSFDNTQLGNCGEDSRPWKWTWVKRIQNFNYRSCNMSSDWYQFCHSTFSRNLRHFCSLKFLNPQFCYWPSDLGLWTHNSSVWTQQIKSLYLFEWMNH